MHAMRMHAMRVYARVYMYTYMYRVVHVCVPARVAL
jgi:hypothetical protein